MSSPVVFDGPEEVSIFRAIVIKQALRLYAKTGMKANRAYTPSAMMAAAREITGRQDLKARAYMEAADALEAWIEVAKIRRENR